MTPAERFARLSCNAHIRSDLRTSSVRAATFTWAAGAADFVLRIGSTAILARLVLPEHFGLVMMVMGVTSIADQFRDLGLSSATIQRSEITHQEVSNLFWINTVAGTLIALLVCAVSPLISLYYKDARVMTISCILAVNFVLGGLTVQHQALLTRRLRLGTTSTVRLLSGLLSTILAIVLAWLGYGYWALVWREVARYALLTAGMFFALPWLPAMPARATDVRGLVGFGAHISAANILTSISASADRLLLGRFWGAGPVAIYRQGYQLLTLPMEQLLGPLFQVTQPGLSLLQTDDVRYRKFYQKVLTLVCIATMPVSVFVALYAGEITRVLLGPRWANCTQVLVILSLGTFFKSPVAWCGHVLITRGRSKMYLALTVVGNVMAVLLMVGGVWWGAAGIAVADVAATYLYSIPRLHYSFKGSPVTIRVFFSTIARPTVASLLMAAVLLLLRHATVALPRLLAFGLGAAVAGIVFPGLWFLMPGGRADLLGLVKDLRSALQRKRASPAPAAPVVLAN